MNTAVFNQITKGTFAIALVFIAAAFAFAGTRWAVAVFVGALVVLLNWFSIRWIVSKITQSQSLKRSVAFLLLGIKMLLMISVSWILLEKFDLQPIGFGIGMSALVLGVIVGTGMAPRSDKSDENMENTHLSIAQEDALRTNAGQIETSAFEPTHVEPSVSHVGARSIDIRKESDQ